MSRTVDSNSYFIESKPMPVVASVPSVDAKRAKREAIKRDAIIQASLRHRAKRAKSINYGKQVLQAIDYLLGDKYRDNRTMQERRLDEEYRACKTTQERIEYTDKQWELWGESLLKDRETVQAMRVFLADDVIHDGTIRQSYADMTR